MSAPRVILYGYPQSPFFQKVQHGLAFRRIPYSLVSVSRVPPRPDLQELGITHRRIPIAAIDGEIYADTSAITLALEEKFKEEDGFPSLLNDQPGLQRAASFHWAERTMFQSATTLLPWADMPKNFVEDREKYTGRKIDGKKMEQARPAIISAWLAQWRLVEDQLSRYSKDTFILGGSSPTHLDITLFFTTAWAASFPAAPALFKPLEESYPLSFSWFKRMQAATKKAYSEAPKIEKLDGKTAQGYILQTDLKNRQTVVWDKDPMVQKGWFKKGQKVTLTPDDTGRDQPQAGVLVGLTDTWISIDVDVPGKEGQKVRFHTPRTGFVLEPAK